MKEGVGSKREIVLVFKRVRWSVVERQSVRERERERESVCLSGCEYEYVKN